MRLVIQNSLVKIFSENDSCVSVCKLVNLYEIEFKVQVIGCYATEADNNISKLWHQRYGHIGYSGLRKFAKGGMVKGIDEGIELCEIEFCKTCIRGKMCKLPFTQRRRSSRILEIVHMDVCGPITPTSIGGEKYYVSFIDDYSNFVVIYVIGAKSDVFECFKNYYNMGKAKFGIGIHKIRCDNGGEFSSFDFRKFCYNNGIVIDYCVPYAPQQNGKAERLNRTIMEKARCMLDDAGLPSEFWAEAVQTAAYLYNRSPGMGDKTAAELWYGCIPDVSNLRVFGSMCYMHRPDELRRKLDAKA